MDNTLSADIIAVDINAAYDNAYKRLLSHKIILAWIMHSCLDEYRDIDVNDIAEKYIKGSPQIDTVGVMPEQTNASINGLPNDDASINEHNIRCDIRFYASAPKGDGLIKLIINLEAQNKYHTSYPLIKRGIYYLSQIYHHSTVLSLNIHIMKKSRRYTLYGYVLIRRMKERTLSHGTVCMRIT